MGDVALQDLVPWCNDLGQRVRKTHKGDVRHFVYDGQGQLIGEYNT